MKPLGIWYARGHHAHKRPSRVFAPDLEPRMPVPLCVSEVGVFIALDAQDSLWGALEVARDLTSEWPPIPPLLPGRAPGDPF